MTRRELLATAAAVPAAALKPAIRPDGPWVKLTLHRKDRTVEYSFTASLNTTEGLEQGVVAYAMCEGETFTVESSEHEPIVYKHTGPLGDAEYFWDGEFGYILGPPLPDGWFNLELKHKGDAS